MFYIFILIVLDTTSPRQQLHPCPAPRDIQGVRLIFGDEILTELELGDNLRMNDGMIGVEVIVVTGTALIKPSRNAPMRRGVLTNYVSGASVLFIYNCMVLLFSHEVTSPPPPQPPTPRSRSLAFSPA